MAASFSQGKSRRYRGPRTNVIVDMGVNTDGNFWVTGFCRGIAISDVKCTISGSDDKMPHAMTSSDVDAKPDPNFSQTVNRWIATFGGAPDQAGDYPVDAYNKANATDNTPKDSGVWQV